jgi:hypothetical protein
MIDEQKDQDNKSRRYWYYGSLYPGIWMLVIGIVFLLNNFGYLQGNAWGKLWPLFIIIPALFMIFRPRRRG